VIRDLIFTGIGYHKRFDYEWLPQPLSNVRRVTALVEKSEKVRK
jgi:hypothetical protein